MPRQGPAGADAAGPLGLYLVQSIQQMARWYSTFVVLLGAGLGVIAYSGGCVAPAGAPDASPAGVEATTAPEPAPPPASPPAPDPAAPPRRPVPEDDQASGPPYRFRLKPRPGEPIYYTIENEIRDLYGFPPLLSVTASVKERRFITQQATVPQTAKNPDSPQPGGCPVTWTCERYEVRERGLKDEVTFDSIRDLYPPPSLWILGGIPGSVCAFELDPTSGTASHIVPRPAQIAGSSGSAKLSRTAERCALTVDNLKSLLDDFGPLYLPDSPKDVGEQWSRTFSEDRKSIGTVTTTLTCALRSVRETSGRKIATIEITSEMVLHPETGPTSNPAGGRAPGSSTKTSNGTRPYQLDKGDISGTVEFDLTRGELVSLKLHREAEFFAELDSTTGNAMVKEIRTGSSQDLRVSSSHTPPPMPVIVGGKKPPVLPPESEPKPAASQPVAPPSDAATSPPTTQAVSPLAPTTTRPGGLVPVPSSPSTQPASRRGAGRSHGVATRPAKRPPPAASRPSATHGG